MEWSGQLKSRNVEIAEDLHAAVKSEAAKRGIPLYEAYAEALTNWLGTRSARQEKLDRLANLLNDPKNESERVIVRAIWELADTLRPK